MNQLQLRNMPGNNKDGVVVLESVDTRLECRFLFKIFVMGLEHTLALESCLSFPYWQLTSTDFQLIKRSWSWGFSIRGLIK